VPVPLPRCQDGARGLAGLLSERLPRPAVRNRERGQAGAGPRLQEAVVLYTGQYAYRYEDWAWVLPLSQLWA
jgi:hypothetical protein